MTLHLPGYEIEAEVASYAHFSLHRCRRSSDKRRFLLKLVRDSATSELESQLVRELEVCRQLGDPALRGGVVRARELLSIEGSSGLVLEDPGGQPLDQVLRGGPLPLELALGLASELAGVLDGFHRAGLIHRDLRPSSLLVDVERRRAWITGLGSVSEIPRERRAETGKLEGAPAYMSPEQTGRTNRLMDYRTDFYSLGVTLYEMLTGQLPFAADNLLGWVHAHVARQPLPLEQVTAGIPPAVSRIVLKLLGKTADDRYQSGEGLRADLDRCLGQLRAGGTIRPFALGEADLPVRFELPQRLYGRGGELASLASAFEQARRAPVVLLVTGPSGMGKSALIDELRQQVLEAGGLFVAGKYEELGRSQPLSGILEALRGLVRRFLGADPRTAAALERELARRLGTNLGVVVGALPELAALVGEPPPVPTLGPVEERLRYHRSIGHFLRVFATEEQPLVVFLDDLQWIDRASLEMLASCLDPEAGNLLLLGAYRDDQVAAGDPLPAAIGTLRQRGVAVDRLRLGPLGREAVAQWISATLRCSAAHSAPLAEAVFRHSRGHPLKARGFLTSLHERGILSLARQGGQGVAWRWDLGRIAELEAVPSSVRGSPDTVSGLSRPARRLLALAAALGGRFDPHELAVVGETSRRAAHEQLLELCRAGLLIKREDGYQFVHDQVREGAYELIAPEQRAATHLRIGRLLSARRDSDDSHGVAVFEILDHFNRARELLSDPQERVDIARLNLSAGRRALAGAAFSAAHECFSAGLDLLDASAWREHYELTLALHNEGAEATFLVGEFDDASRLVALVHRHARTLLDEVPAYEVRISVAVAEMCQEETLDMLIEVLGRLGVVLSAAPRIAQVEAAVLAADRAVQPLLAQDPRTVPAMTDPAMRAAVRLLARAVLIATWTNQLLVWAAACKALELMAAHGHCAESGLILIVVGHMRCQLLDDVEGGKEAATFGLALLERSDAQRWKNLARLLFLVDIESFRSPIDTLGAPLSRVYRASLEGGDLLTAMLGAICHCLAEFHSGTDLVAMEKLVRGYHDELLRAGAERVKVPFGRLRDIMLTLLGRPDEASAPVLVRPASEQDASRLHFRGGHAGHHFGFTYSHDIQLHHLFGHRRHAFEVACRAVHLPEVGTVGLFNTDFYLSLALLGGVQGIERAERRRVLNVVESRLARMRRRSRNAPMTYRHRVDLVEAERSRVLGRPREATTLYLRAAQGARKSRYVQDEALAFELAAELQLELRQPDIAALCLGAAAAAYERWHGRGKLDDLAARYPDLLDRGVEPAVAGELGARADTLDKASLERAAQALSQTLVLDRLLRELVSILLENAAAQRGFLLRDDGEQIFIEASGSIDGEEIRVGSKDPLEERGDIAQAVVRYVQRTRETVVLGEAAGDERFAADPYIVRQRPKSILCLPILHQGSAVAIVYLENNRIHDAFVAGRLAAVQLIASQAAVALENARLHEDLRQTLRTLETRNAELSAKNIELERFTFTASHDLKTPLVTIRGFLGHLAEDVAEGHAEQIEIDLQLIEEAAGRMAQLLDDLLELSRIGWLTERRQRVDLAELARRAVQLVAGPIVERGVEVTVADHLPAAAGDPSRLLQVFQNLLENAVQFMGEQPAPRIEIGASRGAGEVVCHISDNGIGIEPSYHDKVFGLFKKLDAASGGTGAGLAIVKQVVEAHGGRVWVESEGAGKGAAFYFTLPAHEERGAPGPG